MATIVFSTQVIFIARLARGNSEGDLKDFKPSDSIHTNRPFGRCPAIASHHRRRGGVIIAHWGEGDLK